MSIFNPEQREDRELRYEANKFSPDTERKLLSALKARKETYPDIVQCPIRSCGCPVKVEMEKDFVRLYCTSCGWEKILKQQSNNVEDNFSHDRREN